MALHTYTLHVMQCDNCGTDAFDDHGSHYEDDAADDARSEADWFVRSDYYALCCTCQDKMPGAKMQRIYQEAVDVYSHRFFKEDRKYNEGRRAKVVAWLNKRGVPTE